MVTDDMTLRNPTALLRKGGICSRSNDYVGEAAEARDMWRGWGYVARAKEMRQKQRKCGRSKIS